MALILRSRETDDNETILARYGQIEMVLVNLHIVIMILKLRDCCIPFQLLPSKSITLNQ